jgi:hypothetical protein
MSQPKLHWVKDRDANADPTSVRIHHGLLLAGFLSFMPLFFWKNQYILGTAATITWIAFIYSGLLMIFGSRGTILSLWRPLRPRPWIHTDGDSIAFVVFIRLFGAVILAFMLSPIFPSVRNSFVHAFQHGR